MEREADYKELEKEIDRENLPRHVAIIMDGNGRWAKKHHLPRNKGHLEGIKNVKKIVKYCKELGIEVLTLFAFSTENWARPKREVNTLMNLLYKFLREERKKLAENNIKLMVSGQTQRLPTRVQHELKRVIEQTKNNTGLVLNLALSYGGREEIVKACREIAWEVSKGKINIQNIDETAVCAHLYTAGLPDPDLLIRTSGELRISNFLLWQLAYTEFYFTPVLWPDFSQRDLVLALIEYQKRERRFGRVEEN